MKRIARLLPGVVALVLAVALSAPAAACPNAGSHARKSVAPSSDALASDAAGTVFAVADESAGICPYLGEKRAAKKRAGCGAHEELAAERHSTDAVFAATDTPSCGSCGGGCAAHAAQVAATTDVEARTAARAFALRVVALFRLDDMIAASIAAPASQVAVR